MLVESCRKRVEVVTVLNGNAYDEGWVDVWISLKEYWKVYTVEKGKLLEGFHAVDGLKWQ